MFLPYSVLQPQAEAIQDYPLQSRKQEETPLIQAPALIGWRDL